MNTKNSLNPLLRLTGRVFLAVIVFIVGLITFGLIRESIIRNKYQSEYLPPGQMVDLGTHNIHLFCIGENRPTVVFESDLDQYGVLSWDSVQDKIGELTRACSYDRAGILWSEPGPRPRDGETIVNELAAVLDVAGEEGPYVLVGHAFGGVFVRIFAGQNLDDVCGMVLVDSGHPDELTRFAEVGLEKEIPEKKIRPLILLLSHLGMPGRFKGNQYNLSLDIYKQQQAFLPKSSMAWFDETVEAPSTLSQAGQYKNLGDIALIVLANAKPTSKSLNNRDPKDIWLELQQELTLLSENNEIRVLEDAGHYIQFGNPEAVIDAIRDVIDDCNPSAPE